MHSSAPEVSLAEDGIRSATAFIAWDDIDKVFIGGETLYVNASLAGQERFIHVVSKSGTHVNLDIDIDGKLSHTGECAFSSVRRAIVSRIASRQWREFVETMHSGKPVMFSDALSLRSDGLLCGSLGDGTKVLPFDKVLSYNIHNGQIDITYKTERDKSKKCSVGTVGTTANIHVLTMYLDHVVHANQKKGHKDW